MKQILKQLNIKETDFIKLPANDKVKIWVCSLVQKMGDGKYLCLNVVGKNKIKEYKIDKGKVISFILDDLHLS